MMSVLAPTIASARILPNFQSRTDPVQSIWPSEVPADEELERAGARIGSDRNTITFSGKVSRGLKRIQNLFSNDYY